MAHQIPAGLTGRPGSLFATHCPTCPLGHICGERETDTACGDPGEYRRGALHPATVHFETGDEHEYDFPELLDPWPTEVELPLVLPVASKGTTAFPSSSAIDAAGILGSRNRVGTSIACLASDDATLEKIWNQRGSLGLRLKDAGISLVIAPAFSTWWSDPPFEGHHEMARTAQVAACLAPHVTTVPAIAWRTDTDIARWAAWLAPARPAAIAVDLCTLKPIDLWYWGMHGVAELEKRLQEEGLTPRLVVIGPITRWKLRHLATVLPHRLTVASRGVWQRSRAGYLLGLENFGRRTDLTFPEVLARNISYMEHQLTTSDGATLRRA